MVALSFREYYNCSSEIDVPYGDELTTPASSIDQTNACPTNSRSNSGRNDMRMPHHSGIGKRVDDRSLILIRPDMMHTQQTNYSHAE